MNPYNENEISAFDAIEKAQWIAFAPVVFQAARALKNFGILELIENKLGKGETLDCIKDECNLSHYGARVLCESGLAIGLLSFKDDKYFLTKTAHFFLNDKLTVANCDFINDVCYQGLFSLEDSVKIGKPEGLKVFGNWPTIYEGLSELPPKAKESWFKFDHYYSDQAFNEILPLIFKINPSKILDIGGNTGKFSFHCLDYSVNIQVTIMDLAGQLNVAKANAQKNNFDNRLTYIQANILDPLQKVPSGYDIIWMSQFLDCFSDDQIVSILKRCVDAMSPESRVCILEPFWDRQRFVASAFSLQMTSLYFTSMANGNSQMYKHDVFVDLVNKAGLIIEESHDNIGVCHTLLICKKAN